MRRRPPCQISTTILLSTVLLALSQEYHFKWQSHRLCCITDILIQFQFNVSTVLLLTDWFQLLLLTDLFQRSDIAYSYSFRDHVARVQSRSLCLGSSVPYLNDLLFFLQMVCRCKCVASMLCVSCLISEFLCLIGLNACNKNKYSICILIHYLQVLYTTRFQNKKLLSLFSFFFFFWAGAKWDILFFSIFIGFYGKIFNIHWHQWINIHWLLG